MHKRRGQSDSWTRRARSAGGRVLGHAGNALGEQHLGTEALVAFVDGELTLGAHQRAAAHVAGCLECSDEVRTQVLTRSAVRSAAVPVVPVGLLGALRGIPGTPLTPFSPPTAPTPPHGVVLDEHGAWVAVLRPDRYGPVGDDRTPPSTRGRGALGLVVVGVGMLTVGVLAAAPAPAPVQDPAVPAAAPVQQARFTVPPAPTAARAVTPDAAPAETPTAAPAKTPQTATSPPTGQAGADTVGRSAAAVVAPAPVGTARP